MGILFLSIFSVLLLCLASCGSVVGWGTMLQLRRLWVQVPMRSLDFFSWPSPSSRTVALRSTHPLTEMSTKNILGGKGRPACRADNHAAIYEPIVYKVWEPEHLTTLWAYYRGGFMFLPGEGTGIRQYFPVLEWLQDLTQLWNHKERFILIAYKLTSAGHGSRAV